jgi:hypothetical protein
MVKPFPIRLFPSICIEVMLRNQHDKTMIEEEKKYGDSIKKRKIRPTQKKKEKYGQPRK